jgi:uncharacterized protein YcbK (DUF882 family)
MARIRIFKKGESNQLTKNFNSTEWDCSCKDAGCVQTVIDLDHVEKLQAKRDKWGKSVKINSGYRCPAHNAAEGGATKSRHLVSDATDIVVSGMTVEEVASDCEDFQGVGRYDTFTHIDSRPGNKARWNFRKNK